jgi:radical SAM protein with 4Fe4S-binding SPASM domain
MIKKLLSPILKMFSAPYPYQVTLEFTTRCNSKCVYCGRTKRVEQGSWKLKDLQPTMFEAILGKLKSMKGLKTVIVGGWGEPTLCPEFIHYSYKLSLWLPKVHLKLYTNGVTLDEYKSSIFNCYDEVTVSLNHTDRETYLKMNQVDKYNVVMENIKGFCAQKPTYLTLNVQGLETPLTNQWLKELPVNLNCQPMENAGGLVNHVKTKQTPLTPCYETALHLVFDLEGNLYPCCLARLYGQKSDICIGNIQSGIDKKRLRVVRESQKDGVLSKLTPCRTCDLWRKNSGHYGK